ncbi:MAG: hypothetical protein ABF730_09490, partial [Bifidobacterium aquikefiri]|uniref:hypothetical protein n=1 Tax=Bifidobacterium aquikefiri TaxID=1653207 RepID=UPI0039ED5C67
MKARTHQAGMVRFGQPNVKSRKGSMNFHREGAALGRRRGAQSIVRNERRKKSRLLSKLSSGIRSTTPTLTGRDQRDMNERLGDKSKQLLQTGAKRFARTGVKAGAMVARKTTVWAARSTATTVRKTAPRGPPKAGPGGAPLGCPRRPAQASPKPGRDPHPK